VFKIHIFRKYSTAQLARDEIAKKTDSFNSSRCRVKAQRPIAGEAFPMQARRVITSCV